MNIGIAVDVVILIRILLARWRKETGMGWIIYLAFAASSLIWIPLVVGD